MPDNPEKHSLFVVSTPIGNLGDTTARAIDTLRSVQLIAAEDTRHTRKLLSHFGIRTRLVSYHAHNERERVDALLEALSRGDVALVSDAGTPVVSDPGQELVRAAAAAGHPVFAIPGPSAVTAAVAVSGLAVEAIHFTGFLPRRSSERRHSLAQAAAWPGALVCFEAPHRLRASLQDALDTLGNQPVAVCCELTKLFEHTFRGRLSDAIEHYAAAAPRGEFTLVIQLPGREREPSAPAVTSDAAIGERFTVLEAQLGDRKAALAALARETGLPRKSLYARLMTERP